MTAPERNGSILGYWFAPVPRDVIRAMRSGMARDDLAIVTLLYDRADLSALRMRRETPRLTLLQIAEGIGWTGSRETLGRRLRRLRDRPERLFTYRVEGRRGTYVFTLHPDSPDVSERRPTSQPDECPTSEDGAAHPHSRIAALASVDVSDLAGDADHESCPTSTPTCPTSPQPECGMNTGRNATPAVGPVRPPQTFREHHPSHRSGDGSNRGLDLKGWAPDVREVLERARDRHPGDVLAAELLAAFPGAVEVEDDIEAWTTILAGRIGTIGLRHGSPALFADSVAVIDDATRTREVGG